MVVLAFHLSTQEIETVRALWAWGQKIAWTTQWIPDQPKTKTLMNSLGTDQNEKKNARDMAHTMNSRSAWATYSDPVPKSKYCSGPGSPKMVEMCSSVWSKLHKVAQHSLSFDWLPVTLSLHWNGRPKPPLPAWKVLLPRARRFAAMEEIAKGLNFTFRCL